MAYPPGRRIDGRAEPGQVRQRPVAVKLQGHGVARVETEADGPVSGDLGAHEALVVARAHPLDRAAGLVRDESRDVKVLGDIGEDGLKAKLDVKVARVSASARKLIEGAGGSVTEAGSRRDKVRGIDRNSDDQTPKNLTKKLKKYQTRMASKQG